ncbi:S41 family peptidase [Finegoldia magna]|uniref:S41 family peptidase n=1 Tax=Finegoldia TaxID=150022 RepID=UPI000B919366|nr:S41 family peptidase [Finegoldia magna]MDU7385352.1 S41 family peptidase [Finegoldia magna]OXZ25201.1 hypothetical protein B9N52_05965 [Finegoldia magna]
MKVLMDVRNHGSGSNSILKMFIAIILIITMTSFNYKDFIVESNPDDMYEYLILNKYKKIDNINIDYKKELTQEKFINQVKAVRDFMNENQCFYELGNKEEITRKFNELLEKPEGHTIEDLQLELMKIMTNYKQGHITTYNTSNDKYLPIIIGSYKNKYYIIASEKEYSELLGSEILKINNIPIQEIKDKVSKYVSYENDTFKNIKTINYMNCYNILEKEKIVNSNEIKITINSGKITTYKLPVKNTKNKSVTQVIMDSGNDIVFPNISQKYFNNFEKIKPLNKTYFTDKLFYTEGKGDNLIIRYNSCTENDKYKIDEFTKEIFQKLDSHKYKNIIFDLRYNTGGDSRLLIPIILKVKAYNREIYRSNIKVLIGKSTYSSAGDNSLHILRYIDDVEVIGENGGFPINTGSGNMNTFYLKDTYIISTYCKTVFFNDYTLEDVCNHNYRNYDFNENMMTPDFRAEQSFADYMIGNDPAMNYALRDEGNNSLIDRIKDIFN